MFASGSDGNTRPTRASAEAPGPAGAVVGGRDVAAGDSGWVVGSRGCTGALVALDRVLTAAHCVRGHHPAREQWFLGAAPIGQGPRGRPDDHRLYELRHLVPPRARGPVADSRRARGARVPRGPPPWVGDSGGPLVARHPG